ncbi:hypothetical protein DNF23_37495 [Pseudomonas syringae pv. pisi]
MDSIADRTFRPKYQFLTRQHSISYFSDQWKILDLIFWNIILFLFCFAKPRRGKFRKPISLISINTETAI